MAENTKKIILDTDIGDDIDDAFALVLCLASPEVELLGVTTVFRNGVARAKMTKALAKSVGVEGIKVYAGMDNPLIAIPELLVGDLLEKEKRDKNGKYYLPQYSPEMDNEEIEEQDGVNYIIECAKKYGKDLYLAPIGALTNIATANRLAPDVMKNIGGITVMGGCFYRDIPEWNMICDPEAARIVFSSGIPVRAVGLDVTLQCVVDKDTQNQIRDNMNGAGEILSSMLEKWFDHYRFAAPVMHDPLAVSTLIQDGFVKFKTENVDVVLEGGNRAKTVLGGKYPIEVAYEVDTERFMKFFKGRIFNQ